MSLFGSDEYYLVRNYIKANSIIFDVGANEGHWTYDLALPTSPKKVYLFEPSLQAYDELKKNFQKQILEGVVVVSNCALFSSNGKQKYYHYPLHPSLNSIFRRTSAEEIHHIGNPENPKIIQTITLDCFCEEQNIMEIDYLKLDVEGSEVDVILGSVNMLAKNKIKCIEFEYGGTYIDAKKTLKQMYDILLGYGYKIYKARASCIEDVSEFQNNYEDYEYFIYMALREN